MVISNWVVGTRGAGRTTHRDPATDRTDPCRGLDVNHALRSPLFGSLGKFRLSIATDNKPLSAEELPPAAENLLDIPDSEQTEEQRQALATQFLLRV